MVNCEFSILLVTSNQQVLLFRGHFGFFCFYGKVVEKKNRAYTYLHFTGTTRNIHCRFNSSFLVSGFDFHLNKNCSDDADTFYNSADPIIPKPHNDPTKGIAQMQKQDWIFFIRHNFSSRTRSLFVIYTFNCFFCRTIYYQRLIPSGQVEKEMIGTSITLPAFFCSCKFIGLK